MSRIYPSAMSSSLSMRVNPASSLAKGLQFWPVAVSDQVFVDIVSGATGTVVSGTVSSPLVPREGRLIEAVTTGTRISFDEVPHGIGTGPFTLAVRWKPTNLTVSWPAVVSLPNNDLLGLYVPDNTEALVMSAFHNVAQNLNSWNTALVTIDFNVWSITHSGPGQPPEGYKDGIHHNRSTTANWSLSGGTSGVDLFRAREIAGAIGINAWTSVHSRVLDRTEQYDLATNPMQMFTNTRRVMWIPSVSVAVSPYQYGAYWM